MNTESQYATDHEMIIILNTKMDEMTKQLINIGQRTGTMNEEQGTQAIEIAELGIRFDNLEKELGKIDNVLWFVGSTIIGLAIMGVWTATFLKKKLK